MKAIIFGFNGQDGYYLKNLLSQLKINVFTSSRSNSDYNGDISDTDFVQTLIKKIEPDYIFNFAAVSSVSHEYFSENKKAILDGTINILESCRLFSKKSKIFISGSALQFKNYGIPINEFNDFDPSSIYSVFRINSVHISRYYREQIGLKVYIGYLFNHDSPFRLDNHINQKILRVVKSINDGNNVKLALGDINAQKEFGFAGDIVQAIWILVNQDKIFETVIGTGLAYSIKDWLDISFNFIKKNWEDYIVIDNSYKSPYKVLVSDPKTIFGMNWKPEVNIEELCLLMWKSINDKNDKGPFC